MSHQAFEPNQFILHDHDTQIKYLINRQAGVPELDYQTTRLDRAYHFSGNDIHLLATEIGRFVTVTLICDLDQKNEIMLTLLLPTVYLPVGVMEQVIQAEIITTTRRLPQQNRVRRVDGQVERYQTRSLHGIAQLIEF